jgi:hypothetical protein
VIRGGSWNNHASNCRAANRNRNKPSNRNNNLGFRLARAPQVERRFYQTEPTAFPFRRCVGSADKTLSGARAVLVAQANAPSGRG